MTRKVLTAATPEEYKPDFFDEKTRALCRRMYEGARGYELTIKGVRLFFSEHPRNSAYFLVTPVKGKIPMACLEKKAA